MARIRQSTIMVSMTVQPRRYRTTSPHSQSDAARTGEAAQQYPDVAIVTRRLCTVLMIIGADVMTLAYTAIYAQQFSQNSPGFRWAIFATIMSLPVGFLLVARDEYPDIIFVVTCAIVIIMPYDAMLMLMALTALVARRSNPTLIRTSCIIGAIISAGTQIRDALQPHHASIWGILFADTDSGVVTTPQGTIVTVAGITGLAAAAAAIMIGLHIRANAITYTARAQAQAATHQAATLQADLVNQQLTDTIAAQAHDTLAHSLSLIALNANTLQHHAAILQEAYPTDSDARQQAETLARTAADMRRQAAGALDEAHSIIDMLRHPEQASAQLAEPESVDLTQASLDELLRDNRNAGMQLNTWIDIRQLSELDHTLSALAYHIVQEGLTNARRHATHEPVSIRVSAAPDSGIHIHISNPMPFPTHHAATRTRSGEGLAGIRQRVSQANGTCQYGADEHGIFHLGATLPWTATPAQ